MDLLEGQDGHEDEEGEREVQGSGAEDRGVHTGGEEHGFADGDDGGTDQAHDGGLEARHAAGDEAGGAEFLEAAGDDQDDDEGRENHAQSSADRAEHAAHHHAHVGGDVHREGAGRAFADRYEVDELLA